jgi:TPR repeat protein
MTFFKEESGVVGKRRNDDQEVVMQTSTMRHLRIAAESGEAAAQFNLGVLYESDLDDNGYAIKGNRAGAIKWLLAAAEQGLPRAQSRLAELYAGGPNSSANHVNACAWFLLATKSSQGIHRHQARSGYERIASRLTPAQRTKAKHMAGLWRSQARHKTPSLNKGEAP